MGLFDDIGRVGLGISTGGLSELLQKNPFGMGGSFFENGKYEYPRPELLTTPQQMEALGHLMAFANSGKFGNFTAGEAYKGPLGNYDLTDLETTGQGKLSSLLASGAPESFGLGKDEIKKLLTTNAYDPNNDGGVYSGLTAGIDYNTQKALDAAKHSLAYTGNLYSTSAGTKIGDAAIQGANAKSGILAQLYQDFANKKFNAIPLALQAGGAEEGMNMNRINAAYTFGSLPRTLADTKAKDTYSEWGRARSESLLPLQMFQSIYSSKPNWNQPMPAVETESPWNRLLDTAIGIGSTAIGYGFGGPAGGAIGSQVGQGVNSVRPRSTAGSYGSQMYGNRPFGLTWR